MSYMKRFLEDVADEFGLDIMDQRVLDEANRRLTVMNAEFQDAIEENQREDDEWEQDELALAQPKSGIIRHLGVPVIEVTLVATEGDMNGIPQLGGV